MRTRLFMHAPDFDELAPDGVLPLDIPGDRPDSAPLLAPAEGLDDAGQEPPPAVADGPATISLSRLLQERPDVYAAYFTEFHGPNNDRNSEAWVTRVGGDTLEDYAAYWYRAHGRYEGYSQGAITAGDNVSVERILQERPDVYAAYFTEYYGPNNDRNSDAWVKRVGGDTPEAYAKYWYEKHGRWEGYAQTPKAAAENIDVQRLLQDRPDVFRAFYTEYYGPNNDRKSPAWVERVGGATVEDYAKYWYEEHGRREGYTQASAAAPAAPDDDPLGGDPSAEQPPAPPIHDPSEDPWNHPAIYPDWKPPYEGWTPPRDDYHPAPSQPAGQSLFDPDPFG